MLRVNRYLTGPIDWFSCPEQLEAMMKDHEPTTPPQTFSQVSCVGMPQPQTWDEYEEGCLGTYRGGHRGKEAEAFVHGMQTVFNLLRDEFKPAAECKKVPSGKCKCLKCTRARGDKIGGLPLENCQMIVCQICGNKRCPHAEDHRYKCTGSNAPDQIPELESPPPQPAPPAIDPLASLPRRTAAPPADAAIEAIMERLGICERMLKDDEDDPSVTGFYVRDIRTLLGRIAAEQERDVARGWAKTHADQAEKFAGIVDDMEAKKLAAEQRAEAYAERIEQAERQLEILMNILKAERLAAAALQAKHDTLREAAVYVYQSFREDEDIQAELPVSFAKLKAALFATKDEQHG